MSAKTNDPEKTVVLSETAGDAIDSGRYEPLPVKSKSRYHFLRTIGFGGMKSVLLVHDSDTDRDVALAMMPDFRDRPEHDLIRFVREARLTASLEHPNIVPVHDVGTDLSGSPYFTMKYLRGMPLSTLLSRLKNNNEDTVEEFPLARLLRIFQRICHAIEFAHARGYCHMDLKPGNVNVGSFGDTFVLDWGLARKLDENGNVIDEMALPVSAGTPGYMAPEQINPKMNVPMGVHSDIYSLGAILYSILALQSPTGEMSNEDAIRQTLHGKLPRPSEMAPEGRSVPTSLEAVAMRAMSLNPKDRYKTVRELRREILAYTSGFATLAEHASMLKKTRLFVERNFLILVSTLLFLALLCATAIIWMLLH